MYDNKVILNGMVDRRDGTLLELNHPELPHIEFVDNKSPVNS